MSLQQAHTQKKKKDRQSGANKTKPSQGQRKDIIIKSSHSHAKNHKYYFYTALLPL